jgi:class 3 adenylate cyclase/DNA-binding SARP family transcriptional activator
MTDRLAVEANGVRLDEQRFPGRQGRMLFAYLAVHHGRPVPRDELAELLWGEDPPATWEKALRVLATKLRALLEECGIDGSNMLRSAFGCYQLTLPVDAWIDVDAAATALERGEAALAGRELDDARAQASTAAELARRVFLPGEDGRWVEDQRRDLRDVLVRALECLRDAALAEEEFGNAVRHAAEITDLEPFRETSYRALMQAHVAAGNPAEALRVYERCRRFLADELGAYPSPETKAVYLEILRSSPGNSDSEIEGLAPDAHRPGSRPTDDEPPRTGRGKVAPVIAGALLVGGTCNDCGANLPQYSKFCPECGHAVETTPSPATYTPRHLSDRILAIRTAIEGERKHVSVLFCDIVRSPELAAQAGPEEYHRVVDRFFALALEEVHRYEGTVNQFLGDGFMALFGAPIAHEDHARRAALAALAVKERSEIDVRIGINSGSVVVGAIGDDLRMDYTASGDTTVLAARLHGAAHPGDVLVSTATAAYLRGYFELQETEPVTVDERTVHTVRIIGRGPRTSPIDEAHRQLAPFAGRDEELESLREALRSAAARGQVIGVSGDPGLGKSRLTYELLLAAETGTVALQGRCLPFGTAVPYLPILDLVRQACGISPDDDRESVAARIGTTLEELGMDPGLGPYLHHALDVTSGDAQLLALDPATIKGRTFEALRTLVLAKAGRSLLVVIEDAHWIDRTSEEFLTELVDELPSVPVLLLATYRPGYNPPWLGKSYVTQIALRPLSREAGEQIVAAILGESNDATEVIVGRGEGNPFFLEELARAARQETDSRSAGSIPTTVQDVLAARIDQLDAGDKSAVQVASVLGREFSLDMIETVWDGDGALLPALDELKRREFLHERHGGTERTFVFKHALTRDVAYDGLLEERRRALHARAGAAVEHSFADRLPEKYELLAFHYSRSSERERSADYLELANRKASAQHAMEEALGYFYEALAILEEELPDSDENRSRRLTLVLDQTGVFHYLHRHEEYHELLLRHEPLALEQSDPGLQGAFYQRLAHRQFVFGENRQAIEAHSRALELGERSGNHEVAALASGGLQWAYMMLGEYGRAHRYAALSLEHLAVSFEPMAYMYARSGAALTYMMSGRWEAALREVDQGVATGAERSDAGMVSFCNAIGALVCVEKRDWATAIDYGNAAKEIAPTVYFRGFALGFLAPALCHTGAVDEGLPVLEQIVPMAKAARHELAWTFLAPRLADAYLTTGDYVRAHQLLLEIHAAAARSEARFCLGASGRCLGEVALAQGDAEEAVRGLEAAIETLRATGSDNELGLALGALARAKRLTGNDLEATARAQEALAILDRLGTLEEPDRLRNELAATPV